MSPHYCFIEKLYFFWFTLYKTFKVELQGDQFNGLIGNIAGNMIRDKVGGGAGDFLGGLAGNFLGGGGGGGGGMDG